MNKFIKGSILLTANQENNIDDQGGEEVVNNTANGLQYLRTSWRVVIVKDTQSNSTDPNITWDQVFSSGVNALSIVFTFASSSPNSFGSTIVNSFDIII